MKYYYLDAPEGASPLDDLARKGVLPLERTLNPDAADITVGRRFAHFTPEAVSKARLNVLWTHEPYLCFATTPVVKVGDHDLHVFNVYNYNVYTDNFFYSSAATPLEPIRSEADLNVPFDKKKVVAVMSGKRGELIVDGKDISFAIRRNEFGVRGTKLGKVDVHGARWPAGISLGESRDTPNRTGDKQGILRGYNFSCCFENTAWDYYTTEKLWESLMTRTLPIYSQSETILQTFGVGAMLQLHTLDEIEPLLAQVEAMPFGEYRDRLNHLIEVFNRLPRRKLMFASRGRAQTLLANFLKTRI